MYDNYKQYQPDNIQDLFCKKCGKRIEDLFIAYEATEYEKGIEICEECFFAEGFEEEIL